LALDHAFTDRAPESAFVGCEIHAANLLALLEDMAEAKCPSTGGVGAGTFVSAGCLLALCCRRSAHLDSFAGC
jgi:hypothetical protein